MYVLFLTEDFQGHLHSGVPFPGVGECSKRRAAWMVHDNLMSPCNKDRKLHNPKRVKLGGGTSENFPKVSDLSLFFFFFFG